MQRKVIDTRPSPPPPIAQAIEAGKRDSIYRAMSNMYDQTTYSSSLPERKLAVPPTSQSRVIPINVIPYDHLDAVPPPKRISSSYSASNVVEYDSVYTADTAEFNQANSQYENSMRSNVFFQNRPESVPKALRMLGVIPSTYVKKTASHGAREGGSSDSDDSLLETRTKKTVSTKALKTLGIYSCF
jgi:hypothetical protein